MPAALDHLSLGPPPKPAWLHAAAHDQGAAVPVVLLKHSSSRLSTCFLMQKQQWPQQRWRRIPGNTSDNELEYDYIYSNTNALPVLDETSIKRYTGKGFMLLEFCLFL